MVEAADRGERVRTRAVENPLPNASFGDIGVVVEVVIEPSPAALSAPRLVLPYSDDDLGWVAADTLHIFRYSELERAWHIVRRSAVDTERREVRAPITRDGIYGLFGLPANRDLRRAVQLFASLPAFGFASFRDKFCQIAFCAGPLVDLWDELGPPRGLTSSRCDACLGIPAHVVIPEGQIGLRIDDAPFGTVDYPHLPVLYCHLGSAPGINSQVLHAVNLKTWQPIGTFPIGLTAMNWAGGKVLATSEFVVVLSPLDDAVVRFRRADDGTLSDRVSIAVTDPFDIAIDGSHGLFVSARHTIEQIDLVTATVTASVPVNGLGVLAPGTAAFQYAQLPEIPQIAVSPRGVFGWSRSMSAFRLPFPLSPATAVTTGSWYPHQNDQWALRCVGGNLWSWDQDSLFMSIPEVSVMSNPLPSPHKLGPIGNTTGTSPADHPQIAYDEPDHTLYVTRVNLDPPGPEVYAWDFDTTTFTTIQHYKLGDAPTAPFAYSGAGYVVNGQSIDLIDVKNKTIVPGIYNIGFPAAVSSTAVSD